MQMNHPLTSSSPSCSRVRGYMVQHGRHMAGSITYLPQIQLFHPTVHCHSPPSLHCTAATPLPLRCRFARVPECHSAPTTTPTPSIPFQSNPTQPNDPHHKTHARASTPNTDQKSVGVPMSNSTVDSPTYHAHRDYGLPSQNKSRKKKSKLQ